MTNTVLQWLRSYPGLETLQPETLEHKPGSAGLFCRGLTLLGRSTDILGREFRRQRLEFLLQRHSTGTDGPGWLLELAHWANATAPTLGQDTILTCGKGRLVRGDANGIRRYELQITFEFTQEV